MPGGSSRSTRRAVVIGGGFCGLAAAWQLARDGVPVTLLERDASLGGLAGSFAVGGARLEKFYHHWFAGDRHVTELVAELGLADRVVRRRTRTGMYYANRLLRFSSPLDLLRFRPLRLHDRLRLAWLVSRARRVKDWHALEGRTARDWLIELGGEAVYRIVWAPLLRGKFGRFADDLSAVWMWNKLLLRGGSRGRGRETLAYFRGGFAALADAIVESIVAAGGQVLTGVPATGLRVRDGRVTGVTAGGRDMDADAVIATPALPIVADLLAGHADAEYLASLRRIQYLGNICVVAELGRSLSDAYWVNVNDPSFPFVGVIEHTNFEPPASYGGRHIVYLSRYVAEEDPAWTESDEKVSADSLAHLRRMFPDLRDDTVLGCHVWRERYAQPVVVRHYGRLIPDVATPIAGLHLATMAQVYPEDRGTNQAIRDGRVVARRVAAEWAVC